eukprot:NODE_6306_length_516_cov_1.553145.p2 GENE.NODE_6306_length_516_cov_1.553145~~NODE_6306_length_516_cov_1.553145.p2  ORF type:complete len:164 (+),score=9.74 NODE_6306_length_516_cov_1.553145:54-494(+)
MIPTGAEKSFRTSMAKHGNRIAVEQQDMKALLADLQNTSAKGGGEVDGDMASRQVERKTASGQGEQGTEQTASGQDEGTSPPVGSVLTLSPGLFGHAETLASRCLQYTCTYVGLTLWRSTAAMRTTAKPAPPTERHCSRCGPHWTR